MTTISWPKGVHIQTFIMHFFGRQMGSGMSYSVEDAKSEYKLMVVSFSDLETNVFLSHEKKISKPITPNKSE